MTALSSNAVSAVIRLAHKYHVADTQNQALLFLQDHCFTSDFDRYEEHTKGSLQICDAYGIAGVNLARLTDTPSLLPDALLSCCLLQGAIFDGWKREDGTVEHLSAEDLRRCVVARTTLTARNLQIMGCVFEAQPSDNCDNPPRCSRGMDARCSCLVREGTVFEYGPIIDWAEVIRYTAQESAICSECEKDLQARNARERRKFWEDLPKIFGITVDRWPSSGAGN
ncbi:hypothetical protein LXA43DRAFT_38491 [Ganoderma leucocontextum]|nr:hypothetical protein LXA43DRAFT_38491 [Ganoderma leucocontextum]